MDVAAGGEERLVEGVRETRQARDDQPPLPVVDVPMLDASVAVTTVGSDARAVVVEAVDAGSALANITVYVTPWKGTRITFGHDDAIDASEAGVQRGFGVATLVRVTNACCEEQGLTIDPNDTNDRHVNLQYLAAHIVPRCDVPGATVQIDGKVGTIDRPFPGTFEPNAIDSRHPFKVVFGGNETIDPTMQTVRVEAATSDEVKCVTH